MDIVDEEMYWERISELKKELSESLRAAGIAAFPWEIEGDILVEGGLAAIIEWAKDWRSEIEELG